MGQASLHIVTPYSASERCHWRMYQVESTSVIYADNMTIILFCELFTRSVRLRIQR